MLLFVWIILLLCSAMVLLRCIGLLRTVMPNFVVFSLTRKLIYIQKPSKTFFLQSHFWKCMPNVFSLFIWFKHRVSWHSALVPARCIGRVLMVTSKLVVSSWSSKLIYMQQTCKSFHNLNFEISCRMLFFCRHFISLYSEAVPRHFINPRSTATTKFVIFSLNPKLIYMQKIGKTSTLQTRFSTMHAGSFCSLWIF